MERGDKVVLTDKVPESTVYPWAKAGLKGVIEHVAPSGRDDYPYRVRFEGDFAVDPEGCPTIVKNPLLFFSPDEIELAE